MNYLWKIYHKDVDEFINMMNFDEFIINNIKLFCDVSKNRYKKQFFYISYDIDIDKPQFNYHEFADFEWFMEKFDGKYMGNSTEVLRKNKLKNINKIC